MRNGGEFYVGYAPMPRGLRRFVVGACAAVGLTVLLGAALLPGWHRAAAHARSDFRDLRTFEGTFLAEPAPHLLVARPGDTGGRPFSRYFLVGRGKSGPRLDVAALDGHRVAIRGSLVYRADQTLIAVKDAEVRAGGASEDGGLAGGDPLGRFTLRGEIVDSKCHLGTMRPGDTKTHRGCAIRCIAGGIPPALRVRDESGAALYFLLVGPKGEAVNQAVLDFVSDPVEIAGEVVRLDDTLVLLADPAAIRRR